METEKPDGSVAKIVYRQGGTVDPIALEKLCGKVRLVCSVFRTAAAAGEQQQGSSSRAAAAEKQQQGSSSSSSSGS